MLSYAGRVVEAPNWNQTKISSKALPIPFDHIFDVIKNYKYIRRETKSTPGRLPDKGSLQLDCKYQL